jgi:hypothetical protein
MEMLGAVAAHPLTLLLVGAALTNYLIPRLTSRWQDRQNEVQLKTALVSEISDASLDMLISVQYAEMGAASQTTDDYDNANRRWETARMRIAARLQGYFQDEPLQAQWRALAEVISSAYALSGTHDPGFREWRIAQLKSLLPGAAVNWDTLADVGLKTGAGQASLEAQRDAVHAYRRVWFDLREAILAELGAVSQAILDARPAWLQSRRSSSRRDARRAPAGAGIPPPLPVRQPAR